MRSLICVLCLSLLVPSFSRAADDQQWKLVFQDDFNRTIVGNDWNTKGARNASIKDGRFYINDGEPGYLPPRGEVRVNRSFGPDLRVEFDAETDPKMPPCDMDVLTGACLYVFGGINNRNNRISGSGVRAKDLQPNMHIEFGKKYHFVATQDGAHYTYSVNGITVADVHGKAKDKMAGLGFDHLGIVTYAGMYVEHFKVYERVTPSPDNPKYLYRLEGLPLYRDGRELHARPGVTAPGLDEALAAFNSRDYKGALLKFKRISDTKISLAGQAYVIGDLGYEEKFQGDEFVNLAKEFDTAAKANPGDKTLADYAVAADYFGQISLKAVSQGGLTGGAQASILYRLGPENNPFYYKAILFWGRATAWGDSSVSGPIFSELKKLWPENMIVREYSGEEIPWATELNAENVKGPEWATHLREAYARQVRIIEHWSVRQAGDGQLGGGWNDDCELLRGFNEVCAMNSAAEPAKRVVEKLCEGIWNYDLHDGIAGMGDAEHSTEDSMDSVPTMMLLRYGDPLWAERNMLSCKTIHNRLMAIDKKGYPRFYSSEWGFQGHNTGQAAGGDTAYNTRMMKHYIWQIWLRNDPVARDWYVRYVDGWRNVTMKEYPDKPFGLCPATLWYPSGDIYPPNGGKWYAPEANYYGVGFQGRYFDAFLNAYYFSRDMKFLDPFLLNMDWATRGPVIEGAKPPTLEWAKRCAAEMPSGFNNKTTQYRWMTGDTAYDEYTRRFASAWESYMIDRDLDKYLASFKPLVQPLRYNLDMQSTEVLTTDAYKIPYSMDTFAAYTGAVISLRDENLPTFAATYDAPDLNLACVVTDTTNRRLRIRMYSFDDTPMKVGIRPWLLQSGYYIVNGGEVLPGEFKVQKRYGWGDAKKVKFTHKGEPIYVTIPPGKEWVVDIRMDRPVSTPQLSPDLAINARDISKTKDGIDVVVHNIGHADAKPFDLIVQTRSGDAWKTAAYEKVPGLAAPRNFNASRLKVAVPVSQAAIAGGYRVLVNPGEKQYEFCMENNTVEMK